MSAPDNTREYLASKSHRPTALVAGGAGFIGSHLVRALLSQNFHVVAIDNLSTGKKENLKDILTAPNFTFIQEDINNPGFKLPPEIKIDYCFHLASSEDYHEKEDFSLDMLLVNSLGTRQLLEIARANNAKFILLSAADLYSGAISSSSLRFYFGKSPENENILSLHEAKRFAEALTFEYFKKFNLQVTVVRVKDVYGPKMNFDRGDDLGRLVEAALQREKLNIPGDGLRTINPTFISDVVFGLVKASLGSFSGEIFILVNPEKITLENFAQNLKMVAGPLEIEHKKDSDQLDIPFSHLDLDNTKEKLAWTPKVSLPEGLSALVQSERIQNPGKAPSFAMDASPLEIHEPKVLVKPESQIPKTKLAGKSSKWVRGGIFVASLSLIVVTVIYPLVSASVFSYFGKNSLQQSVTALQNEQNSQALNKALEAQNSFEEAASSLQKVTWLLKIVGVNETSINFDHLLQAQANLAQGLQNSAKASSALVTASTQEDLSEAAARDIFDQVLSNLYTSKEKLEQTELLLATIDWGKVPSLIASSQELLNSQTVQMQKQVDELIVAIEELL